MKIVHFTLGRVNPDSSNGINRVIEGLARFGNEIDSADIQVVTLKKNLKVGRKKYKRDGFNVTAFNSIFGVLMFFKNHKEEVDLVHLHNVWSRQNIILSAYLRINSIPYIVTVHAGLMQDRVKNSNYFLKIIFQKIFQKNHLDKAVALHAISREEITNISEYTSNQDIFYIPNGINTSIHFEKIPNIISKKITIGCLGRLAVEKNILGLITAIDLLPFETKEKITLNIMGPLGGVYANKCVDLVKELKLQDIIFFTGKIDSSKKWIKLSELDVYIQPSLSEGASLTILEAMYADLPIIASRTCNVSYMHGESFLKMVEPIPLDITRGVVEVIQNIEKFKKSGIKAHDYIINYYDWEVIAKDMTDKYKALHVIK